MIKERMEKLAAIPFSVSCISHSSIAAIQPKRYRDLSLPLPDEEEGNRFSIDRMKNVSGLFPLPKSNISEGLHRLIKIIRTNISQLITFKEEEEEIELELEIGNPTDVKHVTHIGWDGSATTNTSSKSWDDFREAGFFTLSPVTLQQHGINLAVQADTNIFNAYSTKQASDTIN